MAAKERHAAAFITLLLMVLHSSAEEDSAPAGKKVYVDIFKFLNTDDPILSFTISRSSGNPCKVDFYRNTTASGTLFERFYWAPNRRTNLEQMFHDSLKGVFQNSGTAAPEVLNTMYVSKGDGYGRDCWQGTEIMDWQSSDNVCAKFSVKRPKSCNPGRRSDNQRYSAVTHEIRMRVSESEESQMRSCLQKLKEPMTSEQVNAIFACKGKFRNVLDG
uniref:Putative lipocalin-3 1 n=1 Tax=Amblyomma triste TaxID=251400 RepID=A0A023GAX6_AMBTT